MANPDENQEGDAPFPASPSSGGASTSYTAEGAPPDLLRNTPSNIARLEDAIENCAARRKYLARTKSPSDGEDVRWYFCKLPLGDRGPPSPSRQQLFVLHQLISCFQPTNSSAARKLYKLEPASSGV
jgi:hypothetical protein